MNGKSLACFAAAERTGSFSTAAWELYTTQQSVSYNIRKLEEELGFPLFIRRTHHVELTPWGAAFFEWYKAFDQAISKVYENGLARMSASLITDVQIRCFLLAVRLKSVNAAAKELYYSSPQALTGILLQLERLLGEELFQKNKKTLLLTDAGRTYYDLFDRAAAHLADTLKTIRAAYDRDRHSAVVGISEWLRTDGELGRALAGFTGGELTVLHRKNPELLDDLQTGRIDIAIWSEDHCPVNRGLEITPLAREELCVFLPADGSRRPILLYPSWTRSHIENLVIFSQESSFEDYTPSGKVVVQSIEEMEALLSTGRYCAVGDRRFGRQFPMRALQARPLDRTTHIVACRKPNMGDNCASELLSWLTEFFVDDTKI